MMTIREGASHIIRESTNYVTMNVNSEYNDISII